MENNYLNNLSDADVMNLFPDIIESGEPILIAKCPTGYHEQGCWNRDGSTGYGCVKNDDINYFCT